MSKYLPRIADDILKFKLESSGAVWIKGPKWCGKSTTANRFAHSSVFLQDPETGPQSIDLARNSPRLFLRGEEPRLIDEWQTVPSIWDSVRYEVDQRDGFGHFILAGSATPVDTSEIRHSGIGRIVPMVMRPMSLFESQDSTGAISLGDLFAGKEVSASIYDKSILDYAYLVCRGGWPSAAIASDKKIALMQAINYYDSLVESDMAAFGQRKRDVERIKLFMRSYSRNISTQAQYKIIKDDMVANDNDSIDEDTISSYIEDLEKLFVIEELRAWNPNLRSRTAIRTSNTKHFVDPSIACAALELGPNDLINDIKTFGLLFESMCIRDLRIFAEKLGGKVYHYRDETGLEADAVIHLRHGEWAPVEIKLADSKRIDEGAKNLLKLVDKIDLSKMKKPKFLMVLTATRNAYQREDGVWVVPIGCLRD